MAFSVPTFNLTVNVHDNPSLGGAFRFSVLGNLAYSSRGHQFSVTEGYTGTYYPPIYLLLPGGTDIRDLLCGVDGDYIECPAATGRWYLVMSVDDAGKGFPNEHRVVMLQKSQDLTGGDWPIPIP